MTGRWLFCKAGLRIRLSGAMNDSPSQAASATLDYAADHVSAASIWAVALGALSLLTLGLTAMPAIVCGYVALAAANKRHAGAFEKRAAIAGLLAGCAGAALLVMVIATMLRP